MSYLFEIVIILILIVINGIFAMAEFAIVSVKKTRLQQRADQGDKRAAAALEIVNEPTQFLSTVQIGITLVGIFAVHSEEPRSQENSQFISKISLQLRHIAIS